LTKLAIIALLIRNPLAVEAAMVALYQRQTEDERSSKTTKHSNGRGFNYHHAQRGSYYARWVQGGRHLTGHHLNSAREMAIFYARQLGEIAEEKRAAKLAALAQQEEASLFV
jgi:hypothetical protein